MHLVLLEILVPRDRRVFVGTPVCVEVLVSWDQLVLPDSVVSQEPQDNKERQVDKDPRAYVAHQECQEKRVAEEQREFPASEDLQENPGSKEPLDPQDFQEQLVHRDLWESKEILAQKA